MVDEIGTNVKPRRGDAMSGSYYRCLLDSLPERILVVAPDRRVVDANRATIDHFGGRIDEIVGRPCHEIGFGYERPCGGTAEECPVRAVVDSGEPQNRLYRYALADGSSRWVEVSVRPMTRDGRITHAVVSMKDVTDLFKDNGPRQELEGVLSAREALEIELKRTAAIIDQVDESIIITDRAGEIVYVNPAFERVTGYLRGEVIGKNPRILQSGKHPRSFYESMWKRLTSGKPWKGRLVNKRKDGTLFNEDASISPAFGPDGEITHYVGVERDVTREVENENQLRRAQKMEAIGTLAGGIAHDFNNILSSIIGFSELALDAAVPGSRQYDHIRDVLRAGKRAADLVRQILAITRQGPQSEHLHRSPIQLGPVVHDAMVLIRASLPSTIQIRERIASDLPAVVADPTQVHQVVLNLCTNAHHAMREMDGTLTVELSERRIDEGLSHLPAGGYVELRVEDTGTGIAPEIRDRIFDPYFTTKNQQEGTGLGLSVVDGIVREHGGRITVESEPGRGAVFTVLFPASKREPTASEGERTTEVPKGSGHVLLVDDEAPIARILEEYLVGLGYTVTMRTDSAETLATFAATPDRFDLVITDMTMPHMTGDRLSRNIHEIRPDVPVIICTGFSDGFDEHEAGRRAGISGYLRKPVDRATLAAAVREALGRDRKE